MESGKARQETVGRQWANQEEQEDGRSDGFAGGERRRKARKGEQANVGRSCEEFGATVDGGRGLSWKGGRGRAAGGMGKDVEQA